MRILHSFWTKAYFQGRWGMDTKVIQDLHCFALSYHFAKKHFGEVHLVTDNEGASLLDFLEYDDVSVDLESISTVDPRFWTAGKVKAAEVQNGDFLHIDGDVFLIDPIIKGLVSSSYDAIVQMREVGHHFNSTYPPIFKDLKKVYPYIDFISLYNFTYNTGIFGFKDQKFKEEYCRIYFDLLWDLQDHGVQFPADRDPNIVVEQSLLTTMAQNQNKHVKELITLSDMNEWDLFGAAERIGFVHLWGNSKYQDYWQQRVRLRLKEENPSLMNRLEEKLRKTF